MHTVSKAAKIAQGKNIRTWADIDTGNTDESITRTFAAAKHQCDVHLETENHHSQVP